mgnify:CR=1 FL=1
MTKDALYVTEIWHETPSENPYYAKACYCYGYNIYEDVLAKAAYPDYLYLLLTGQRPTKDMSQLFEKVLIALAHPGLRDPSVRAAMNAGVGGSRAAAALMGAIAVGAGQAGGAHELRLSLLITQQAKNDITQWSNQFKSLFENQVCDVWPALEFVPGFDPHQATASQITLKMLDVFAAHAGAQSQSAWLLQHYKQLEQQLGYGLNFIGATASALFDLHFTPEIAEYFFMIARLPGAAIHAQESRQLGHKKHPFFTDWPVLLNDPGPVNQSKEIQP